MLRQVLEMLEKGETPPNIRTDIMDEPPDPAAVPSSARLQPRAKPWERSAPPAASSAFPTILPGASGGKSPAPLRCRTACPAVFPAHHMLACCQGPMLCFVSPCCI